MKAGTDSYERIWRVVGKIPPGRVATYGQIARLAGLGDHARIVGYALHTVPPGLPVPWHRVINAKGMISLPRSSGAYAAQKRLLEAEGILFSKEKVELGRYGWRR